MSVVNADGPSGDIAPLGAAQPITGSMIYGLSSCESRLHLDLHGDHSRRDPVSDFVQMLWRVGSAHEDEVLAGIAEAVELRSLHPARREALKLEAMRDGAAVILGARVRHADLLGEPDVLRRVDGGYVGGDVKSRGAFNPAERPKESYAGQLAHYAFILAELGLGRGTTAFVIDRNGDEVPYDLTAPVNTRIRETLADRHARLLEEARGIRDGRISGEGAMCAACKLYHWRTQCRDELRASGDLTLVPQLGRSLRSTIRILASDIDAIPPHSKTAMLPGLGREHLRRFQDRARLLTTPGARAYATTPLGLTRYQRELFFDIEADPSRDRVYLHGVVERNGLGADATERFHAFFTEDETLKSERDAFAACLAFLTADPNAIVYYWSKYERTSYRALQARYPDVCSPEDIEALFDGVRAIDLLYEVVAKHTEWPTNDHSIKTLAKHCGFEWRDVDPGGAASISWYDDWCRTRDPAIRARILEYNEGRLHRDARRPRRADGATGAVPDLIDELPGRRPADA